MAIGQKRYPGETPVALRVPSVSPGIENKEGGVGFAKDVHGDSGNNLAHRQAQKPNTDKIDGEDDETI
jgi:hypothetical protein